MLNDGLNAPREWDRASLTMRKKSDVISPEKKNQKKIEFITNGTKRRRHNGLVNCDKFRNLHLVSC